MGSERKKRNIYLVGLMGAGKTTIGKVLARRLSYSFIDSDHEIARRTGVSVPTIFEIEGEEGFRKREAQIIAEIAALDTQVVATGGGVVLRPENRQLLLSSGLVVYLNVPLHTLYERTRHDKNRPLLQVQDPLQKLKELHIQRDPLYREVADIVVSGSRIALQSILPLIAQQI
ncbi:MAG TPA: shikimate kinase [Accumulibacter sp.]|nr:shikimate kinase [Accumulibacter sp.]